MFWVLKRTVSSRRFFRVPTTYVWLRNKKKNFQLRTLIQFLTNGSKSLIRTLAQDQFIFLSCSTHLNGHEISTAHKSYTTEKIRFSPV